MDRPDTSTENQMLKAQHNCKIKLTHAGNGGLWATYHYTWGPDISCEFTMLSEVAQSLQPVFRQMLSNADLHMNGTTVFDFAPWRADCLTRGSHSTGP